jgi:hypothetical protein
VWSEVPFAGSSVLVGTININIIREIIMIAIARTILIAVIHSVIIIIVFYCCRSSGYLPARMPQILT